MSNCDRVIRSLEDHSSRINKEQIIEVQAQANNLELFEGFSLALSSYTTFGVKQVPQHKGPDGPGFSWSDFKLLCNLLVTRSLTGDAARDAIANVMAASTVSQWNDWYRRILIKDLRCGVSEKTINKVLKNYLELPSVPVFECMLAHDGANHESKIVGKKLLEPKLDGVRVITIINTESRTVTQYSRNGKELVNFTHITQALEKHIDLFDRSYVLDGEMVSSSFQALMKQVHRKEDVQAADARLMLFDILPLSEFQAGRSVLGQRRRTNFLRGFKNVFDLVGSIDIIEQIEVDLDSYVGELEFRNYNRSIIDQGYEGIMVKDPNARYECKRSHSWLKIKPSITVDLEVVALEEGTGKNQGRLGALVCEGDDGGRLIRVNVGSGFTDEQRDEIWTDQNNILKQVVEIKADSISQNQDGTFSLRFPRFEKFRGFAAGDKI